MTPSSNSPSVSPRLSFALAFELAFKRDFAHSILVPLLLRGPWILASGLLPSIEESDRPEAVLTVSGIAMLGDMLALLIVSAMLRLRAASVYGTPPGTAPASATWCYAKGLGRLPQLLVTEIARGILIVFSLLLFVLPAVFVGFRFSLAAEAVVLDGQNPWEAFRRSSRLVAGHFGHWLEMVFASLLLIVGCAFMVGMGAAVFVLIATPETFPAVGITVSQLLIAAIIPPIQYAWAFFYLQLRHEAAEAATESNPVSEYPQFAPFQSQS